MADPRFDVAGIGNAIVDVLTQADDQFVADHALPKGGMTLIDEDQAQRLYDAMGPGVEISGGSAANTVAGIASLGGRAAFIGKVRDDTLGRIFRHDITAQGVAFTTPPLTEGPSTARCLIMVTPDAQRTMATYLGACTRLAPADIDEAVIRDAAITYVEGYQWDLPAAKDAILAAATHARAAGRRVAFSLSDAFCVERHHAEFNRLVDEQIDILFANETEALALTGAGDVDACTRALQGRAALIALTRSEQGCRVITPETVTDVPAHPASALVDTTGAGDLFAAGVLWGLCRGADPAHCARIGAVAAAEVISHVGARPEVPSLADLVRETLGFSG